MAFLDETHLRELVYGGAVLGGGGGGSIKAGLAAGREALAAGTPHLVDLSALPEEARLVTLSGVGTVGKNTGLGRVNRHHSRALRLLLQADKHAVAGFIPSEVGAQAVTYGWRESALTGIPIVDAPCDGRAHPLGIMGSLELHRHPNHLTTTVAVGGNPQPQKYLELSIRANVIFASQAVRDAVARAHVSVGVARNPMPVSYVRRHAAVGGLKYAQRVGAVVLKCMSKGLPWLLRSLADSIGGRVLATGCIRLVQLSERGGFTVGAISLSTTVGQDIRILVCNEYMMVFQDSMPMAAFPDLITVFDAVSSLPQGSTDIHPRQRVAIFVVPRTRLKLAPALSDVSLLRPIEALLKVRFPESSYGSNFDRNADQAVTSAGGS